MNINFVGRFVFDFLSAVVHVALSLCLAHLQHVDKSKRSGFRRWKMKQNVRFERFLLLLDLNRWTRSIEHTYAKMLNWLVVNSFWYLTHSRTSIEVDAIWFLFNRIPMPLCETFETIDNQKGLKPKRRKTSICIKFPIRQHRIAISLL